MKESASVKDCFAMMMYFPDEFFPKIFWTPPKTRGQGSLQT